MTQQQNNTSPSWGYLLSKRIVDLVFGITLLLISAPIFLCAALVIRLDSPGNPFFVQKRIGLRGKPFRIIKLRGMYIDARERFPDLYDYSGHTGLDFHFHYEEDPRVTRIGRYTRRTSIDEMPNFINVVLGDMSLVGPRPEVPDVMELYGQYAEEYLSVKPGITCLSKCSGRDSLTKEETIQMDLDYIQRRTFLLDAQVLWWTFVGVVLRRDVH